MSMDKNEQNILQDVGTAGEKGGIHCVSIIGQIEGHSEAGGSMKTTKY